MENETNKECGVYVMEGSWCLITQRMIKKWLRRTLREIGPQNIVAA